MKNLDIHYNYGVLCVNRELGSWNRLNSSYKWDIIELSGGMNDDNKHKYNGFYYGSKSEFFKSGKISG